MPRKFNDANTRMAMTAKSTLCSAMNGTADPMFDAADDIDTATVST